MINKISGKNDSVMNTARFIVYSVVIVALAFLAGAYLFFALLTLATAVYIYKKIPSPDNKFLVYLFVGSMLIRCYLAVLFTNIAFMNDRWGYVSGDDRLYSITAMDILKDISSGTYKYRVLSFGMNLYTYILSCFYGIFGFKLAASKFINCYIGSLLTFVIYVITTMLADRRAARIAAAICALYPSYIFWATHNIKEPLIIFTVCIGAYLLLKTASRQLLIKDAVIFLVYVFMVANLQLLYIYQVILVLLLLFFVYCSKPLKAVMIVLIAAFLAAILMKDAVVVKFILFAEKHQWEMAVSDKAGYYLYPQYFMKQVLSGHYDVFQLLIIYLKGLAYFMLSPFPWRIGSLFQAYALPQIVVWYSLLVFSLFGFVRFFNKKPGLSLAMLMFIFIGLSLWAFTEGNIGAAFRHRDHFAALIFMYAGIGIGALYNKLQAFQK